MYKADLEDAGRYGSEAARNKLDPFKFSVPKLQGNSLAAVGQKWALVVGISKFHPDYGADPLRFAANDAQSFSKLLIDPAVGKFKKENVFSLVDEGATTPAIKSKLNHIATEAKPEDIVLIYISTHGSSRQEDLRQVNYLYTYDTNVTNRDDIFGTALPMVDVSQIVSTRCLAERTVIMFDTCHSGGGAKAQSLSKAEFNRLRAGAGRYVVSSCTDTERSYEDNGHGFFTASLMAAMSEKRGCIRMKDLFERVKNAVSESAKKLNKDQHPTMLKSDEAGEIILGSPAGEKSDACLG